MLHVHIIHADDRVWDFESQHEAETCVIAQSSLRQQMLTDIHLATDMPKKLLLFLTRISSYSHILFVAIQGGCWQNALTE